MSLQHEALLLKSKGSIQVIEKRYTPTPNPYEVLINVHSVALNPVDLIQKKSGFHLSGYPAILGYDISGTIEQVGSSVTTFSVGDRVLAMSASWFDQSPNYGAFQKKVLVPYQQVTIIPDDLSFNEASILPLAIYTAWFAFVLIDQHPIESKRTEKQGILIWGVSGSVGSVALQIAKLMGFNIYATASEKHHDYLKSLGKGSGVLKLFDYKNKQVKQKIIDMAKQDGVNIDVGIEAASGNLSDMAYILNKLKSTSSPAKIGAAPFSMAYLWYKAVPSFISGVSIKFVDAPSDRQVRLKEFETIYNSWLYDRLQTKEFVPCPKMKVVGTGLDVIEKGLEELQSGVSGIKLVVELDQ